MVIIRPEHVASFNNNQHFFFLVVIDRMSNDYSNIKITIHIVLCDDCMYSYLIRLQNVGEIRYILFVRRGHMWNH